MSKKIRNVEDQKKDFDKVLKEFEAQQEADAAHYEALRSLTVEDIEKLKALIA